MTLSRLKGLDTGRTLRVFLQRHALTKPIAAAKPEGTLQLPGLIAHSVAGGRRLRWIARNRGIRTNTILDRTKRRRAEALSSAAHRRPRVSGAPAPWFRLDVISGMPSCDRVCGSYAVEHQDEHRREGRGAKGVSRIEILDRPTRRRR